MTGTVRQQSTRVKFTIFYTKLNNRLLHPLLAADQPQAPAEVRSVPRTSNHQIDSFITRARSRVWRGCDG